MRLGSYPAALRHFKYDNAERRGENRHCHSILPSFVLSEPDDRACPRDHRHHREPSLSAEISTLSQAPGESFRQGPGKNR